MCLVDEGVTRISLLDTVTWKNDFLTNSIKSLGRKVVLRTTVAQTSWGRGSTVRSCLYTKEVEEQGIDVRSEELVSR